MLSFRQPGDMARYVADNDPGQIAAGFSNLEDFLAAGNKIPEYKMGGRQPLQGVSQDIFGAPNILTPLNPKSGAQQATPSTPNTESFFQVTPPSVPVSEQTPLPGLPPSNNFVDDTRDKTLPQISDPAGLRNAIRTVNPIVSGPEEFAIASNQQIPDADIFNRVGQQLIGYDDQFSGINDRLNKIEEGIASLMQNRGQGLNMNTGGLGYFFNPFGGFYG
jgi:hypothetical protein